MYVIESIFAFSFYCGVKIILFIGKICGMLGVYRENCPNKCESPYSTPEVSDDSDDEIRKEKKKKAKQTEQNSGGKIVKKPAVIKKKVYDSDEEEELIEEPVVEEPSIGLGNANAVIITCYMGSNP